MPDISESFAAKSWGAGAFLMSAENNASFEALMRRKFLQDIIIAALEAY